VESKNDAAVASVTCVILAQNGVAAGVFFAESILAIMGLKVMCVAGILLFGLGLHGMAGPVRNE
jgi:hypothetical protein